LKKLLVKRAYSCERLVADRQNALEKLRSLFDYLIEHPDKVSPGYRQHLADTPPERVVCDYVAGMTDAYLLRVHEELVGSTL